MAKTNNTAEEKTLTNKEVKEQPKVDKQKAKKPKKEKKPGLFRKIKEAWSELKKVSWPSFASVVKKTGIVILVVLIFTIVLLGMDVALGALFDFFKSKV